VGQNAYAQSCTQTINADVVVFDSPTVFNRLGAQNPNYITYALKRDVVNRTTQVPCSMAGAGCEKGNVELRPDKRPRPLVVRSVAGACLNVTFTNWLAPTANPNDPQQAVDAEIICANNPGAPQCILDNNDQVAGRCASFHATGTELQNVTPEGGMSPMDNDGSMVGANPGANTGDSTAGASVCGPGMAAPGEFRVYNLYTPHEGAFIINSHGARLGSEGNAGNLGLGMFGALNVQPAGARMYRSQVTEEELRLVTTGHTSDGQPIIDYELLYPTDFAEPGTVWDQEGKGGLPVLNMLAGANCGQPGSVCELVHSDINAIIVGPNTDGSFPASTYPLESVGKNNPQLPNRLEPYREFTSIYHDEQTNAQVYPKWYADPVLKHTIHGVRDAFMINYGSGGIGSEIISNRLHTGPMHDCTDCAYEEFFLARRPGRTGQHAGQHPHRAVRPEEDPRPRLLASIR
jgi:hypothetical protein